MRTLWKWFWHASLLLKVVTVVAVAIALYKITPLLRLCVTMVGHAGRMICVSAALGWTSLIFWLAEQIVEQPIHGESPSPLQKVLFFGRTREWSVDTMGSARGWKFHCLPTHMHDMDEEIVP